MNSFTKSKFSCPACEEKLNFDTNNKTVIVWCANGQCDSEGANVGAQARTEEAAFAILKAKIEAED